MLLKQLFCLTILCSFPSLVFADISTSQQEEAFLNHPLPIDSSLDMNFGLDRLNRNALFFVLIMLGIFLMACAYDISTLKPAVVAKVGSDTITKDEFERAYRNSIFSLKNTPSSRRAFLNDMVSQKLISMERKSLPTEVVEIHDLNQWTKYLGHNTKVQVLSTRAL